MTFTGTISMRVIDPEIECSGMKKLNFLKLLLSSNGRVKKNKLILMRMVE